MNKKINCPICNSKSFSNVLEKDMLDNIYYLKRCNSCNLIFFNPLPTQKVLNDYYNREYVVPIYQQKKVIMKSKKVLNILNKFNLPKNSIFFEVGASHGFFLNEVKKRGFKPFGVELSKKAVLNAKKKFNINIENQLFDKSSYINKKNYFDVCCMFDVLEHVINPNPILKGFSKILKSKGKLVLTIPNINSTEFHLYGKHWEWLSPPAHLYYYSPKTISKLLEKYGFKIKYLETYKGDSAGNILFHFYLYLRQVIFYNFKYLIGRKNLLKKKQKISSSINSSSIKNKKEFSGFSSFIYFISELFNPLLKSFEKKRNKKGRGAAILVIAEKE